MGLHGLRLGEASWGEGEEEELKEWGRETLSSFLKIVNWIIK